MKKLILLLLIFVGGALQVSAGTETTVYYTVPSATVGTYTVKLNVNYNEYGDDDWHQFTMIKTAKKYDGKDIYSCTYTDSYNGVRAMQFQLYDGSTWKSEKQAYSSWTTASTYNGKMYEHESSSWKTYRTDATIYLSPNSNWKSDNAWFAIYLDDGSSNTWQKFTAVEGHTGYYKADVSGKWTKCVLCRMNKDDTSTMSWSNKWNQCPKGDGRITLENHDACYTPTTGVSWDTDDYDNSLIPWNYYFMSGSGDCWGAVEAMTNTAGTYTYSFSGATYANKRVSWAPGTSFWAGRNLKSWDDVCKSKTTAGDDQWIYFQNFSYASVNLGNTGSVWYVPASNNSNYNDGTITITFNSSTKAATITCEKTATIGAAGYLTWSNTEKYTVSDGTAYAVKDMGTYAKLTQITNGTVLPESTGILLEGTSGDVVKFSSVASDAATDTYTSTYAANNNLLGSGNSTKDIAAGCYVLYWDGTNPSSVGFKKTIAGTLGAHKAYLLASASAREFLGFEEDVTGIKDLTPTISEGKGAAFDLQGRKVAQPTRGLYIVNGKKVVIK